MELRTAVYNKHWEVKVLGFYIMSVKREKELGRDNSAVRNKTNKPRIKEQLIGTKYPELEYQWSKDKIRKAKHNL